MSCRYYRILIFSHRGRCRLLGEARDNTIGAIEKIRNLGIRGVEIDVWLSKDNKTLLLHDNEVSLTGKKVKTDQALAREILSERNFTPLPGRQKTIMGKWRSPPPLEEILQHFSEIYFNLELKFSHNSGLSDREKIWIKYILSLLTLNESLERVIVSSFNWDAVDYLISLNDVVKGGYLFENNRWEEALKRGIATGIFSLHPHYSATKEEKIEKAKIANLKVIVWTVNSGEMIKRLLLQGVDGIITDYPYIAVNIREELCKSEEK